MDKTSKLGNTQANMHAIKHADKLACNVASNGLVVSVSCCRYYLYKTNLSHSKIY